MDRAFASLDIAVRPGADGYETVAESSYGGTYRGGFAAPAVGDDVLAFEAALRSAPGRDFGADATVDDAAGTGTPAGPPAADLAAALGGALFAALFAGQVGAGLGQTQALADHDGIPVRIQLQLDEAPELATLPWELLRDPARGRYLSLSNRTPIVRHLGIAEPVRDLALTGPLRVLVVIAAPRDLPPLAVEREWERLNLELGDLVAADRVELGRVDPPTVARLGRVLLDGPWHVLHFIGHGVAGLGARQPPALAFCDEAGDHDAVAAEHLGIVLGDAVELRLAVLNACHSARASDRDRFGGVAQELLQQGIPAVVAMQFAISDPAAIAFAGGLYGALTHGLAIDRAVGEARKALVDRGTEWATPTIHLRGDGIVFEVAAATGDAAATATPTSTTIGTSLDFSVRVEGDHNETAGARVRSINLGATAPQDPPAPAPTVELED